jgi:hypothetical protein
MDHDDNVTTGRTGSTLHDGNQIGQAYLGPLG